MLTRWITGPCKTGGIAQGVCGARVVTSGRFWIENGSNVEGGIARSGGPHVHIRYFG